VALAGHPTGPPPVLGKVLLATDLTEASEAATETALELARRLEASLLVVSVIDPRRGGGRGPRVDQIRERQELAAQHLAGRGRDLGVPTEFLIWVGDPGEQIVSAAEAEHADLVVVGSHGRGAVSRFFIGSVSDYVVRHAHCPVLVVRPREPA
jgi:nucleotide-binding universal stress UspA family protein